MVREDIEKIIEKVVKDLGAKLPNFSVEQSREKKHGDYSTNIAMIIRKDPTKIAEKMQNDMFERIEVIKPGFINFFLAPEYLQKQVRDILQKKNKFGNSKIGKNQKVNIEFISANPTGPLTLGNGRGGFSGDVLSNILQKAGYNVTREFYINDRGKQIEDLKKGLYKGEKRTASQIQKENRKTISKDMKIKFDVWFSEKNLYKSKEVDKTLSFLKKEKLTYEKGGALWFKSTKFGDDKDRVLIKKDGEMTYFASDIAYLKNKFDRGFKKLIIFLGADHHGYVKRMKAATEALGYKKNQLNFVLMQLVAVMWTGEGNVKELKRMSKREGIYWGIDELIGKLGLDVVRFFFLQRGANSHLNFDLKLAKEKSQNNPVYYVQYAYARISSILAKAKHTEDGPPQLLNHKLEFDLIKQLIRFEEVVEDTANDYQIQRIPQYAVELAESFHRFYQRCQVISDNEKTTQARLALISATQIVLKNTLDLMGISAPLKM